MTKQINLTETLEKLNDIADWFEQQTQIDVEEGLVKVKEAAGLIKESKTRLKEIENEFVEIKAEIQESDKDSDVPDEDVQEITIEEAIVTKSADENDIAKEDIPF